MTELKAGRELDREIAEKVLHLTVEERGMVPVRESGQWTERPRLVARYPSTAPNASAGHRWSRLREYSTDIASAWEVHLKICEQLFSIRRRYFDAIQEQTWDTGHVVAWPDVLVVLRDRFPEVICNAALQAINSGAAVSQGSPK